MASTHGFGDTLNIVTEDLAVTFGTALAQTLVTIESDAIESNMEIGNFFPPFHLCHVQTCLIEISFELVVVVVVV